jgi:hypothetical protein
MELLPGNAYLHKGQARDFSLRKEDLPTFLLT